MLQLCVAPDYETLSGNVADRLVEGLRQQPDSLLCLASGSTPTRTYEMLVERGRREPTLFEKCRVLKLDEWGGLPASDSATCEHHLRTTIIDPLELHGQYTSFTTQPATPESECARISDWLDTNGPIVACILGLGINGHLGFNEPAESLQPFAHIASLSEASLGHAMLNASSGRPTYGITLGMANIIQSREILLVVSGTSKQQPLKELMSRRISTSFPASFLWLHPNVTVFADSAAAAVLHNQPS